MTNQEVVKLLEEEIIRCRMAPKINGCQMTDEWKRTIEVCEIVIDAIKAQEVRRWIPVTERLPECDGRYLCMAKSYERPGSFYHTIIDYDKYGFKVGQIYIDCVTHWMPLPEPPKEDER